MNCVVCSASTDSFACTRCLSRCERNIGDFPALFAELDVTISRQSRTYRAGSGQRQREDATVAGSEARHERHERPDGTLDPFLRSPGHAQIALRSFPSPVDFDAAEVRWEAWNTLTTWARHLVEQRGTTRLRLAIRKNRMCAKRVPDYPDDDRLIGWLLFNVDAIRHDEAAAEIIDEIGYAHDQIERAIDRSPERIYAGPCRAEHAEFSCVRDLYARPDGTLVCDGWRADREGCGAEHSVAGRQAWLREGLIDQLVPLEDFIAAVPHLWPALDMPPRKVFLAAIKDGRLLAHGRSHVGEPTYPAREMFGVIERYKRHKYAPRRRRSVA